VSVTIRQLNRTTLARQHLLERVARPAYDVIEHLVGLQAQEPRDPYVGLWSRITDFEPTQLEQLLLDRRVVRIVVQRGTVHAVTADDCLVLRPLAQPILDQELQRHRDYAPLLAGVDLKPVMREAARILVEPHSTKALRERLAAKFPEHDPAALAFACRNCLAFVQVPPRGLFTTSGQVVGTTAKAWLGRDIEKKPSVDAVMLRYLAAFGPATVADATTWSRYTGVREVFDRLRPQLRTLTVDGREYFDLPDAPWPDADTPAPARFLPQFDNVLLSHKDRSRFIGTDATELNGLWLAHRGQVGSVMVDGMLAGAWKIDPPGTLTVTTPRKMPKRDAAAISAEGVRLLGFFGTHDDPVVITRTS
jgi:hypothetical protein